MREYLEPMLGATGALIAQFAITLLVILVLVLIAFWLIRRFTGGRFGAGNARLRQPRLSVLDALPIDARRRLILVRRDNVEHLLLIGGPSDVLVEASIQRPPPAQRRAEAVQQRPASAGKPPQAGPSDVQRAASAAMETRRAEPFASEPAPVEPEPPFVRPAEPSFTEPPPAPEVAEIAPPPAPEPVPSRPPAPPAQRSPRGPSGFLSGNRSRAAAEAATPPRREGRVRIADAARPLQRATSSPFAREPAEAEAEPARTSARPVMPPAPPIEASPFGEEPFGAPQIPPPARIEPTIEPLAELELSQEEPREVRSAPVIEPPTREDQPIGIEDAFGEEAPILQHGEPLPDAESQRSRAAQVGDLEKEMARLLGEISGSKR